MLDVLFGTMWWIWPIIILILAVVITFIIYTLVPANVADVVIQRGLMRIFSSHSEYGSEVLTKDKDGKILRTKASYFKIPSWIPFYGMHVHRMPLRVITMNVPDFLAFDKNRARFETDIRAYVVIKDVVKAAKRFPAGLEELKEQTTNIVRATVRDVTTKRTVREIINDRDGVMQQVRDPLAESLGIYGLGLENIELIEFKDPTKDIPGVKERPHVIGDISAIEEVKINSEMRMKNAEETKEARLKEAIAEETAKKRELERDEMIAKRDELRQQEVAKQEKITMEETLEVKKVEDVKTEQIAKAQAEVEAQKEREVAKIEAAQRKEVEAINKEQKKLEGEGDKIRDQEQAIGKAAPVRETGTAEAEIIEMKLLAEAEGKDKLSQSLNKFTPEAYNVYKIIREIEKDENIGVHGADALKYAELKAFLGGSDSDKIAFDVGKAIQSMVVANPSMESPVLNKIAQPNDLGFKKLGFTEIIAMIKETPELKKEIRKALDEQQPQTVKKATNTKDLVKNMERVSKNIMAGKTKRKSGRRKNLP